MSVDPAADLLLPAERAGESGLPRGFRLVDLDEYCRLLISHRSLDRVQRGVPDGYRGLRDPASGQTWVVSEAELLEAS